MSASINIPQFMEAATDAARLCGVVARRLQGKVPNEPKETTAGQFGDFAQRLSSAKTVVDDINEEICINLLRAVLPLDVVVLDGEEATPDSAFFPAKTGPYVLVLDALDGTLAYSEGKQRYGCNIGLFGHGRLLAALVYYPAYDIAYGLDEGGAFQAEQFHQHGLMQRQPLQKAAVPKNPTELFLDYRVDPVIKAALKEAGFEARPAQRGPFRTALEAALEGTITTLIAKDMAVRDLIPFAIAASLPGAVAADWSGQPVVWPTLGGVLPTALFSPWPLAPEIVSILQRHCGTAR